MLSKGPSPTGTNGHAGSGGVDALSLPKAVLQLQKSPFTCLRKPSLRIPVPPCDHPQATLLAACKHLNHCIPQAFFFSSPTREDKVRESQYPIKLVYVKTAKKFQFIKPHFTKIAPGFKSTCLYTKTHDISSWAVQLWLNGEKRKQKMYF